MVVRMAYHAYKYVLLLACWRACYNEDAKANARLARPLGDNCYPLRYPTAPRMQPAGIRALCERTRAAALLESHAVACGGAEATRHSEDRSGNGAIAVAPVPGCGWLLFPPIQL